VERHVALWAAPRVSLKTWSLSATRFGTRLAFIHSASWRLLSLASACKEECYEE
jgi:hypothetical protein